MNTIEQNYADYLFSLNDAALVAQSYVNIQQASPTVWQEVDYYNYWFPLSPTDKEESEYLIFSDLYERIAEPQHSEYSQAFNDRGYSLAAKCKRQKEPMK